ncbi:MAG TPA: FMN-binding protein [Phycisphaerae bacterium]|nr:FMN-binding protein [Phycisphaerae bacterium]
MIRNLLKFTVILTLVCVVMGGGVAVLYGLWRDGIADRERATTQAAIETVAPEGTTVDTARPLAGDAQAGTAVYAARGAGGKVAGWVAAGAAPGYSSTVKVMVGARAPGLEIVRVVVVSQSETPGLGAQVAETWSNFTLWEKLLGPDEPGKTEECANTFLRAFVGRQPDTVRDVQAITAATITSNATKAAVDQALGRIRNAIKESHE